jgi:tRNA pseudouridine32 synthase/23S rRNA pseudouridine746 synthase
VSGLTLWAKDPASHRIAQSWFENSTVEKYYEAFALNERPGFESWQEWKTKLVRGKKRSFVADHGKLSITRARSVGREGDFLKWQLQAVTGRPHQLRFEMSRNGFPIVGDTLYGGVATNHKNWLGLRAVELNFNGLEEKSRLGLPAVCRAPSLCVPSDLRLASEVPSR